MDLTCKTAAGTGVSRDLLGGWSRSLASPSAMQVQFLIAAHRVRPEVAVMLAAIAFGGGGDA